MGTKKTIRDEVLALLRQNSQGLTNKEIIRHTKAGKDSVNAVLRMLYDAGEAIRNENARGVYVWSLDPGPSAKPWFALTMAFKALDRKRYLLGRKFNRGIQLTLDLQT